MRRDKKNNKKNNRLKVIIIFIIILVFTVAIIVINKNGNKTINNNKKLKTKDELVGTWAVDEVTKYEFDGSGNGIMKLPSSEYKFTYILHNNQIYIDFESDRAKDSDYEYNIENNNKLILKGIKATSGTFEFIKEQ